MIDKVKVNGELIEVPKNFENFKCKEMMEPFEHPAIILIGPRRSGKTTALKHFLYENRKTWDEAFIFSSSVHLQPDIFNFVPDENKIDNFDIELIQKIMANQKEDVEMKLKNKEQDKIKKILFIFDDLISDKRTRSTEDFNSIFSAGRHIRISIIVLSQTISAKYGINSLCLTNSDLLISFYVPEVYGRECLIDRYLSTGHNKIGDAIYNNITEPKHTAICVLTRKNERKYEDYVYSFKADLKVPKFMLGKKQLLNTTITQRTRKVKTLFNINTDPDYNADAIQIEY